MNEIIRQVLSLALLFVCGYIAVLVRKFIVGADSETEFNTETAKAAFVDYATNIIHLAAAAAVGKLEQTVGKDLRERVKAGVASRDDLTLLASEAYFEIRKALTDETYQKLSENMGAVDRYIYNTIETKLLVLKSQLYS